MAQSNDTILLVSETLKFNGDWESERILKWLPSTNFGQVQTDLHQDRRPESTSVWILNDPQYAQGYFRGALQQLPPLPMGSMPMHFYGVNNTAAATNTPNYRWERAARSASSTCPTRRIHIPGCNRAEPLGIRCQLYT